MIQAPNYRGPLLPGAVGLTHLKVYDTLTPDGLSGGSAHLHFACTECYYVEQGRGIVQTLSADGFSETELGQGSVVWFSPGVIHRLVNLDGKLEIFVVMQNGGLPEAGDFVLTMPMEILSDSERYFEAASLSPKGEVFASSIEAAYRRRDLAIEGFGELRRAFEAEGQTALYRFYQTAVRLIQSKAPAWQDVWRQGPVVSTEMTGSHLAALIRGDVTHLMHGAVNSMRPPAVERKLGMCGTLAAYLPEGVTVAAQT